MRLQQGLLLLGVSGLITIAPATQAEEGKPQSRELTPAHIADEGPPPLSRVREGGTPYNDKQSLKPFSLGIPAPKDAPLTGYIECPAEYDPVDGVIFWYATSQWPTVVRDMVCALTGDPDHDEIAYVVVTSTSQKNAATSAFTAGGADMSKVQFIIEPGNAIWIRDYGPHFIFQDGAQAIVDSHYYPTRPLDNFNPTLLGDDHFKVPTYDMGLYYSGGNFQPGPDRSGFVTSLINLDNSYYDGFDADFIAELYQTYQGIDDLHVMPQLPFSVDGTGHIDMWMYIVDEDSVIISEFKPGSNPTAIEITDNAVPYMEDLGFEVHRTPAWNAGGVHYTYTNAFRVNDRIFIITYGEGSSQYLDEDADAYDAWEAAAGPDVELIPINCYSIIPASGAMHCIVMQVPRRVESAPAVHVTSPIGGELLVPGNKHYITWSATDTNNDEIPQIDIYLSIDGGANYDLVTSTVDTGSYKWTVPDVETNHAMVKVVATSADTDQGEGVSYGEFQISPAQQVTYDFASGAGVDKFGFGYQVTNWIYGGIDGNRTPVSSEIDTLVSDAYVDLSLSDATGTDYDPNRYRSPTTSSRSTHTFEFTIDENPSSIDDIGVLWEGYADQCTQAELYVWDYTESDWGNGDGLFGQNRFLDNWAGNRDGYLEAHLRDDLDRYVNPDGQMTFLLYGERSGDETMHDYMSVVVSSIGSDCPADITGPDGSPDGVVDVLDLILILSQWGTTGPDGDITGPDSAPDGVVDVLDLIAVLGAWGSC